jgi:hypothetical protein
VRVPDIERARQREDAARGGDELPQVGDLPPRDRWRPGGNGDRFSQAFDDHYKFPYGQLAAKFGDENPDKEIRLVAETNNAAIIPTMTTTFTVPPNVPTTRNIHVHLTANLRTDPDTRIWFRFWLDGAIWANRPARRPNIPPENRGYAWTYFGLFPVPSAGAHTLQVRMWRDGGPSNQQLAWLSSSELSISLM